MKWLHFSDLHLDINEDSTETEILRRSLITFLEDKKIKVDELFFTGDFNNGYSKYDYLRNTSDYILQVAKKVCIKDYKNRIHIVPGNHDVLIKKSEKINFEELEKKYNGNIPLEYKKKLLKRLERFKNISEKLDNETWKDFYNGEIHRFENYDTFSVIYLNSVIMYNKNSKRGEIKVITRPLLDILDKINKKNKLLIILSHYSTSLILNRDIENIKMILNKNYNNLILWFAGDEHEIKFNNTYNITEFITGCIKEQIGAVPSFIVGEFKNNKCGVKVYRSVKGNWEFSEQYTNMLNNSIPERFRLIKKNIKKIVKIYKQCIIDGEFKEAKKLIFEGLNETCKNDYFYEMKIDLSLIFIKNEEYQEAIELLENIKLELMERGDILRLARCYNYIGLANIFISDGYNNAENNFKKSIKYFESIKGYKNNSEIMHYACEAYSNIADYYRRVGKHKSDNCKYGLGDAEKYYKKALNYFENVCKDSLNSAIFFNNYGLYLNDIEKYEKAIKSYSISLNKYFEKYGEKNYSIAITYGNIALAYFNLKKYDYALKKCNEAISIYKILDKIHYKEAIKVYGTLGGCYVKKGLYNDAIKTYFEQLDIRKKYNKNDESGLAFSYHNIGFVYYKNKEYDKSYDYVKKSYDIRKVYTPNHKNTKDTLNLLIKICKKTDKKYEVKKWKYELESLKCED